MFKKWGFECFVRCPGKNALNCFSKYYRTTTSSLNLWRRGLITLEILWEIENETKLGVYY